MKFNSASNGIVGVENYEICIFHKNRKTGLGTIENGLAASGFPPEGPKKERCAISRETNHVRSIAINDLEILTGAARYFINGEKSN